MEAIPIIFKRMEETGERPDWEGEWSATEEVLRGDELS